MQDNFVQSQQQSTTASGRKNSNLDKDNLFPDTKSLNTTGTAGFKPASTPLMEAFSSLGRSTAQPTLSNATAQNKATNQPAQKMVDKGVKEEEKVQMKAGSQQSSGGNSMSQSGSLPSSVLGKMEGAFNTKFDDVKVHSNSSSATNMGALAYAQGTDIHFAPGQYNPNSTKGQELIGHELAHVVQQRQGRVKANTQAKGTPVNDDPRLEKEADEMGKRAARGGAAKTELVNTKGGIQLQTNSAKITSSGPFRLGAPARPVINHDNGFLDAYDEVSGQGDPKYAEREPEVGDYLRLMKWKAMLEGSEALKPGLSDANAAYRHFLEGNGANRNINYERYLQNDDSGVALLNNIIAFVKPHAENMATPGTSVNFTSEAFTTGQGSYFSFPYPSTENWQKTIGGHNVWISATITAIRVGSEINYSMQLIIHAEDRYNFNPGMSDIATGIPDSDNGIFEITGLGHQYMNFGKVVRTVEWSSSDTTSDETAVTDPDSSRNRRPADNRRLRNRL